MNKIEYIAIDFETANPSYTSACSIGLVFVSNSKVIEEKHFLINPKESFHPQNILIHGITEKMCEDALTFDLLWEKLYDDFEGNIIVAHNEQFDLSVLYSLLLKYNLKIPVFKTFCTLKLSRIIYKDVLVNHKLSTIAKHLEVEHNHHNALSDALVCYHLIERAKRMYQVYEISDLYESVGINPGITHPKFRRNCYLVSTSVNTKKSKTNRLEGKIIAFTGKPKLKTKTEVKKLIEMNSGVYSKVFSLYVNCVIIFQNPEKKYLKMLENLLQKKDIEVLSEEEFMKLV